MCILRAIQSFLANYYELIWTFRSLYKFTFTFVLLATILLTMVHNHKSSKIRTACLLHNSSSLPGDLNELVLTFPVCILLVPVRAGGTNSSKIPGIAQFAPYFTAFEYKSIHINHQDNDFRLKSRSKLDVINQSIEEYLIHGEWRHAKK